MPLTLIKCPSCGGELQLDTSREIWFCQFCGSKVVLDNQSANNTTFNSDVININYNSAPDNSSHSPHRLYNCEIYRDSRLSGITKVYIRIDEEDVGELMVGKRLKQQLSSGEHNLSLKMWGFPEYTKKFTIYGDTRITIDRMGTWKCTIVTRFESI